MKKFDLGQAATILANVGVIGGLIFVGLQLRQDRQVAVANSVDATADGLVNWAQLVTENAEVWGKGLAGDPLSAIEALEFKAIAEAWDTTQFASWNRASQGISTGSRDRFARQTAVELHAYPGLRDFWKERKAYFLQVTQAPSEFIIRVNEELELLDQQGATD